MLHSCPVAMLAACLVLLLLSTHYQPAESQQPVFAQFDICCNSRPVTFAGPYALCLPAFSQSVTVDLRNTAGSLRTIRTIRQNCRSPGRGRPADGICKKPPPGSCGDPHVLGFDGSDYLLWGKTNTTYNLLSQRNHQVNIRLYHPPSRADGHALFIDAVGLLFHGARISVRLVTTPSAAGDAAPPASATMVVDVATGDSEQHSISWDGGKGAGERAVDEHTSYAFRSEKQVVISSSEIVLSVVVMDNDHLDVHVEEVVATWGDVHGIMGQSYAAAFKLRYSFAHGIKAVGDLPNEKMAEAIGKKKLSLQGAEDDYITSGLLKTDDKFTRYEGASAVAPAVPVARKLLTDGTTTRSSVGGRALLQIQDCPFTCDTSIVSPDLVALFVDDGSK